MLSRTCPARDGRARPGVGRRRGVGDEGAVIVEFALVVPLLILFLFGIIEFGSVFSQILDVRHGAREGSRLVAVNFNPSAQTGQSQADTIGQAICDKMDLGPSSGNTSVALSVDGTSYPVDATSPGRFATVRVSAPVTQITGLFAPVLNSVTLSSTVESRIEQQVSWTSSATSFASPTPYTC